MVMVAPMNTTPHSRPTGLRLRSRDAEDHARDAEIARGGGEVRLHFTARQRLHANPKRKGLA